MTRAPRRWALAGIAALLAGPVLLAAAAPALAADDPTAQVPVTVAIPGGGRFDVDDAQLRWGLNREAGGGAFFGGCNFLMAGTPHDPGSSRVWQEGDGLYAASDGAVRIEKPDASGAYGPVTWATRCQNPFGSPVTATSTEPGSFSGNVVVVDGGTGTVDQAAGTATIRWTGSFTVVFYGGMTYWTATDPVLTVRDGAGTLTATASGYGADMDDPGRWEPLAPRTVTLATLRGVGFGDGGFEVTPDYLGVVVDTGSATAQAPRTAANEAYWGSFPQDFVDFQRLTGQSSYWYVSKGVRDPAKPATPLVVSYDASAPIGGSAPPVAPPSGATPVNQAVTRPPGGGATQRPVAGGQGALAATGDEAEGAAVPGATGATTVLAAAPLIPPAAPGGGLTAPQVAALGGLAGLALAAGAALGLVKGWLVIPWRH